MENTPVFITLEDFQLLEAAKTFARAMHQFTGSPDTDPFAAFIANAAGLETLATDLDGCPELIEAMQDPETWLLLGARFNEQVKENHFNQDLKNLLSASEIATHGSTARKQ